MRNIFTLPGYGSSVRKLVSELPDAAEVRKARGLPPKGTPPPTGGVFDLPIWRPAGAALPPPGGWPKEKSKTSPDQPRKSQGVRNKEAEARTGSATRKKTGSKVVANPLSSYKSATLL